MIDPIIFTRICGHLEQIEGDYEVQSLFACESGSRAWGFESKDSDYDVRFVYLRPLRFYLRVNEGRDVIEPPPDTLLDFSGWDVRKFIRLALKSNPAVFEWLSSDITYSEAPVFTALRPLIAPCFSAKASMHHYLSMARHNYREHMRDGQSPTVRLKKYLYITRPLLCCRWQEQHDFSGPPPMDFNSILAADSRLSDEVREGLVDLVARKKSGEELEVGEAKPTLNMFIDGELPRLRAVADTAPVGKPDAEALDRYFYAISQTWA